MRTSPPEPAPGPEPPSDRGQDPDPGPEWLPPLREEHELPDGRYLLAYWSRPHHPAPEPEPDRERA